MRTRTFACELPKGYRLICQAARDQTEDSFDPDISTISAVLFDAKKSAAGFFKGYVLHLMDLAEAGEDPFRACDNHSQQLCDIYCALLFKGKVLNEITSGWDGDLLHLDRLWITPRHRGRKLGLACCAALMTLFRGSCRYAVMKPFPLQWESQGEGNDAPFDADRKKLISYYEPLGFIAAPPEDGDYYYRPLDRDILGAHLPKWRRIRKVRLPSAPKGSRVEG